MYAPQSPEPEWIEIYNADSVGHELNGWHIATASTKVLLPAYFLAPNSFVILTKDSTSLRQKRPANYSVLQLSLPTLNNTGTFIALRDSTGVLLDSVSYLPTWGGSNGVSLERRSPSQPSNSASTWGSCIAATGATPGAPNSISAISKTVAPLSLVINEIMFAPIKPEPEWIELLNNSIDTLDLANVEIQVRQTTANPLSHYLLAPDSMVLITTNDSTLATVHKLPIDQIIHYSLPTLSNTGSTITLRDLHGTTIDSVSYEGAWIPNDGMSIERIDDQVPGYIQSNWSACVDTNGATPLQPNSVRRLPFDLSCISAKDDDANLRIWIRNEGKDTVRQVTIAIQFGLIGAQTVSIDTILSPLDSIITTVPIPSTFFGGTDGFVAINDRRDTRSSNDTARFSITRSVPKDSLVINEVMFSPAVGSCEWVELYNPSSRAISTEHFHFFGGQPAHFTIMTLPTIAIPANSFAIVAANATIFTLWPELQTESNVIVMNRSTLGLSNDSASIVLHDATEATIDSVRYYSDWQRGVRPSYVGVSLERRSPDAPAGDSSSWHASSDSSGATPMRANSGSDDPIPPSSLPFAIHFDPNPFSPDGDGFQDVSILTVQLADELDYALRVRLYNERGRLVRTLADGMPMNSTATIAFDGRNNDGQLLAPGLYTALLELSCNNPRRFLTRTVGIAVAGKRK